LKTPRIFKCGPLDPGAFDIWVSRATSLPIVYTPDPDSGGFKWVFGSQVNAPAPDKIAVDSDDDCLHRQGL
jgi:hypothetical protein